MRNCRLSSVKVLLNLFSFIASTITPTLAYSQALSLLQSGTRYAGTTTSGFNGDFGSATTLSLNAPSYIVFDANGNQYISDTQNNCVRKIVPSGSMSTLVGFAGSGGDTCAPQATAPTPAQGLYQPTGLAVDSSNNLYIADSKHNCVRKLSSGASGVASLATVAGTCGSSPSASTTPSPNGLLLDSANNLYISIQDTETPPTVSTYQVLQQAPGSSPCVIAGATSTQVPNACLGVSGSVALDGPSGLAIDAMGDLFIADTGNNCVRQVAGLTTYKTAVGQCSNDSSGNPATALNKPYDLAFSPTQSLLITETSPDNVVSYILGSSTLSIAAGLVNGTSGPYSPTQDGTPAVGTPLNGPRGITADSLGNFFLADSGNGIARELSSNILFPATPIGGSSATLPLTFLVNQAVSLSASSGADFSITSNTCSGSLSPAAPGATPTTCQVFVRFTPTRPGRRSAAIKLADSISGKIFSQGLQANATGSLSVFTPGVVDTAAASLNNPVATAVDSPGDAYILEAGNKSGGADLLVIPAGGGTPQIVIPQGAGLITPSALAIDSTGNYFIADATHGSIARFGADGTINTSYITGLDTPTSVYADNFDNLYIAQAGSSHNVIEVYAGGPRRTIAGSGANTSAQGVAASTASFVSPSAVTADLNGVLYIADAGGHLVYAVDKSGTIHQVAGNGTTTTTVPGQATGTALLAPTSLSVDAAGDIYITDATANRVYTVFASTTSSGSNIASTLGTGTAGNSGDGGFADLAKVNNPVGVAVDGSANLFVVDNDNSSVREITYPSATLAFGTVVLGQSSPVMQQSFSNFGTDNLNLTASISTSNPQFTVDGSTTTCGTTIIAGSTCNLGIVFAPTATGPSSATLVLASNSYNSPQPLNLTGTGQQILPLQFTLPPQTEIYGQPFPETVLVSSTNPAPTGTITFSLGKQVLCSLTTTLTATTTCNAPNSGLSVGTYTVTFSYTGDSNYSSASGTVILTVTQAPLTVTVNNASRLYGAANPALTGTLTGVLPGDTVLVSYSTTALVTSPVGTYPITATLAAGPGTNLANYSITNNPGTLTITQAPLTVNVNNASRQYGAANPTFTGTVSGALNGDSFTVTYSTTATTTSPVGTYPITATVSGPASVNYAVTVNPGTLTVTTAPLSVTVGNATRPYGTANPTFTSTVTGALNGDTFTNTYSTTATINSSVGTYPINDSVGGPAAANYTITVTPGTLTITAATVNLNVAANNATRLYGAANPTFTSTITGALNGDTFTITYATSATVTSPVGNYTVVPTVSGSAAGDYNITTSNGTLSVTVAPLTVTANNASRAYGIANPSFTGTIAGLINGDTVNATYSTVAVVNSPVGTYSIVPTVTGVSSNYTLTTVNGTLTITQNPSSLVVNVNSAARAYGAPNPAFSGTVTGVLPGDDVQVSYSTTATTTSPAGNYPIGANVSGTSAGNYIATIHPGTLAVSAIATTTAVTTSGSPVTAGANVTFTATVTSAAGVATGTVNFLDGTTLLGSGTLNSSGVATYSTTSLAQGTHTINAAFQANTNFLASSGSVTQLVNAPVGTFTIAASPATQYIKGAGATVYQVTLTSVGGFAGQINLSCSGLPADASCNFASNPTLTAGGTSTVAMTVNTTTADAKLINPASPRINPADFAPITAAAVFPVELTGLGVFFAGLRRRKKLGTQKMHLLTVILFSLAILGLTGCGCPSTAFNNYTVVITGTSVNSSAPAQSTSVILSVGNQ
jgi:MBG domain (YGX type)/Bacterial Ig-like domain (group 3)/NHL repeat